MVYPGGKSGAGVYQQIINQMPPHQIYVEGFLGGGSIMRIKRPARLANIAIDSDDRVIKAFGEHPNIYNYHGLVGCALAWMEDIEHNLFSMLGVRGIGIDKLYKQDVMIYLDPPYLLETRRSQRRIYRYELEESDHRRLLEIITGLECNIMLSGYASDLYDNALTNWRRVTFKSQTRVGVAWEVLWMNYPEPTELHDYSHVGSDYRERERIKRLIKRWQARIAKMDMIQRAALMQALDSSSGYRHK